jgi:hypothetical protein
LPAVPGDEALLVTSYVAMLLDRLKVPYAVVGSLASSLHGIPRSTQDADILAALDEGHLSPLLEALTGAFYVDPERVRGAIAAGRAFNVIHLPTMFKIDLFVPASDPFVRSELARRQRVRVALDQERSVELWFASPEDAVLHKLTWYRLGGETSDRQWGDVLGVLRVQGSALDREYLDRWASGLGVSDLLERARRDLA